MVLTEIQTITNILQNLTLTVATLVAAWWAYSTFGYKEKADELLAVAQKIVQIHLHVEQSILTSNLYSLISADEKYKEFKQEAEFTLSVLLKELDTLQYVSFRIPVTFRVLKLAVYVYDMGNLGGIEKWSEVETKEKLLLKKISLLSDVERELNSHRNKLRKISIKIQNGLFYVKDLFKSNYGHKSNIIV